MGRKYMDDRTMLTRMMECSELRVAEVAKFEEGPQKLAASRVLESAHSFRQWEGSHSQLMRGIVGEHKTERQVQAVKRMALAMIHRKAPFEYLRDQHVHGPARHRFFRLMYGAHDFANTVVREHRSYLASVCSFVCVDKFCAQSTLNAITAYEKSYTSYWRAHASYVMGTLPAAERAPQEALLQWLRDDLKLAREQVLESAPSRADSMTLEELRRPTGDTVRMKVLDRNMPGPGQGYAYHGWQSVSVRTQVSSTRSR
jgi:hypothetical protein